MAYEYVNENNGVSTEGLPPNLTTLSVSSSEITTINPLIFLNNSFSESNDGNLQARDELKVPQIEDEHLGAIDTVCVWLRYKLKSSSLLVHKISDVIPVWLWTYFFIKVVGHITWKITFYELNVPQIEDKHLGSIDTVTKVQIKVF